MHRLVVRSSIPRSPSRVSLDGFFADQNGTNFQVTQSTAAQTYLHTNGGEGGLITDTYVDPHGYVVNGHHLSDHCPVVAELRIERISEGVDTANIVTGSRTRRKSTKYNTGMDVDMTG
jgi:Histone chaperone domain CHZ